MNVQNVIDRMEEVAGLMKSYGVSAALPRLERHIQDLREESGLLEVIANTLQIRVTFPNACIQDWYSQGEIYNVVEDSPNYYRVVSGEYKDWLIKQDHCHLLNEDADD